MKFNEIIKIKRDGGCLSAEAIDELIKGIYEKRISEHILSAFLMAVYLNGMTSDETVQLTSAMIRYGKCLSWEDRSWSHLVVDKHSTGGQGDKVSHVMTPILAACGLKIPMVSGRCLSITGGTLDKLEALPGFNCNLTLDEMKAQMDTIGCFISSQTDDIAPTDKVLYRLRCETETVASIPLITGSIIAKKLVEGLKLLILDVKYGRGAFMKTAQQAEDLAMKMKTIAETLNVKTIAIIDSMDSPLGYYIGNAVEIFETWRMLHNKNWNNDLGKLIMDICVLSLTRTGKCANKEEAATLCREVLENGRALETFKRMLCAQGVAENCLVQLDGAVNDVEKFIEICCPHEARVRRRTFHAAVSGYIKDINAQEIGYLACKLGALKLNQDDVIRYGAGIHLLCQIGDSVMKGDVVLEIFEVYEMVDVNIDDLVVIGDKPKSTERIFKVLE